jgi:predicted membrane protein
MQITTLCSIVLVTVSTTELTFLAALLLFMDEHKLRIIISGVAAETIFSSSYFSTVFTLPEFEGTVSPKLCLRYAYMQICESGLNLKGNNVVCKKLAEKKHAGSRQPWVPSGKRILETGGVYKSQ